MFGGTGDGEGEGGEVVLPFLCTIGFRYGATERGD